jgi:hypothetical protein
VRCLWKKRVLRKHGMVKRIFLRGEGRDGCKSERMRAWGKDSFCGCSIPTVFNQRWIF